MTEENPEYSESIEMSDSDQADLLQLFSEPDPDKPVTHRPILLIWREVLKPAVDEMSVKPTPQWATRITASYQDVRLSDMYTFRDLYYGKIADLGRILEDEIATDDECLTYTTAAEDLEFNTGHYKNLVVDWQLKFLQWELDWDCLDEHAAADIAAISEIHKMFFGQTGLTAYLENINFDFTEDDQQKLGQQLEDLKEKVTGE